MRRLLWLALLLALPAHAGTFLEDRTPTDFSVIIFMTDDVSDDVGFGAIQGSYDLARSAPSNPSQGFPAGTPEIDSLRAHGIRFTNVSRPPACAATRWSLLSGHEAWQSGVWNGAGPGGAYPTTSGTAFTEFLPANVHVGMFGKLGASGDGADPTLGAVEIGIDYLRGRVSAPAGDWFTNSAVGETIGLVEGIAPAGWAPFPTSQGDYLGDFEHQSAADWIRNTPGQTGNPYVLFVWPNHAHQLSYHIPPPAGDETVCAPETDQECVTQELQWHSREIGDVITAAKQLDPTMAHTLVIYASGDNGDGLVGDPDCLNGNSKGFLCQAGINADDLVIAYGDVDAGLRGGVDSTTPIQITDLFEFILDYTGTSGPVPDTGRFGLSFRNQVNPGSCTVGALCYDGLARCIYVSGGEPLGVRQPRAANMRSATCTTAATNGFRYLVNDDAEAEFTYAFPDETNVCTGAACDAATLEYRTTIQAHDSLPLPFTCLDAPAGTVFCTDYETADTAGTCDGESTVFNDSDMVCDFATAPSPLAGLQSLHDDNTSANGLFLGWDTDCSSFDCEARFRFVYENHVSGFGNFVEQYNAAGSARYCTAALSAGDALRVGFDGSNTNGAVALVDGTEYDVYLFYDRSSGDCIGSVYTRSALLDKSGTLIETVTQAGTSGLDVGQTYYVSSMNAELHSDDLHVVTSGP